MTFVSYAQNYEDVILWRALNKIEKGFYVDIGAWDPVHDSVTKAFYDRGWRGINIEPVRHWYDKLVLERPEDINLNIAISDNASNLHMHHVVGTGLSTFDRVLAEKYREEMGFQIQDIIVPAFRLDTILEAHSATDIHFLKVDVEGSEKQVFSSINLKQTRPWIILTEITNLGTWEPLLIARDYSFVYFDGLNRFYLANERSELRVAFGTPPNVFDSFVRFREWSLQKQLEAKDAELKPLQSLHNSYKSLVISPLKRIFNFLSNFFQK